MHPRGRRPLCSAPVQLAGTELRRQRGDLGGRPETNVQCSGWSALHSRQSPENHCRQASAGVSVACGMVGRVEQKKSGTRLYIHGGSTGGHTCPHALILTSSLVLDPSLMSARVSCPGLRFYGHQKK